MRLKMKRGPHRYDVNRTRHIQGHEQTKYKKCLSMMMPLCIKEHLSNIWSSIHEKS